MEHAALVRMVHGAGDDAEPSRGVRGRHPLRGRRALDKFHREEVPAAVTAEIIHRHDVRMFEAGRGGGLGAKAFEKLGVAIKFLRQDFQRHHAVEFAVPRAMHDSRSAARDGAEQFIFTELFRAVR